MPKKNIEKVSIIGLGYVGLPLAYLIAEKTPHEVVGFDIDQNKIHNLQKNIVNFDCEIKNADLKKVQITFSDQTNSIENSNFIIVCVPTPVYKNKLPDFKPLKKACELIARFIKKSQKIIIESTINPGVCEEIVTPILEKSGLKVGKDFELAHCPERINPGDKKWTLKNIPRNLAATTKKGTAEIAKFYRSFIDAEIKELSSVKSAEASKIIENTFRDINIAYVNELAKSFDIMGIDIIEVISAAQTKPFAFIPHYPGCGVGGHCIPVDPYYLIQKGKKMGFDHQFLKMARKINNSMPAYTVELLEKVIKKIRLKKTEIKIGLFGLSYKGNIDDVRESPSLEILEILKHQGFKVKTFDPFVPLKSDFKDLSAALKYANIIIIGSDHNIFKKIPPKELQKNDIKIIIDGKNCLDKNQITALGIEYKGIGH